jgi:hypothetical protein
VKRGGFWQHSTDASLPCSFLDEQRARLRHGSDRLGRQILFTLGVDASRLQLAAVKLLRTSQGEGQQEIHYDIPDYDRACQCFSLLLYLTPTESTAVPTLPLSDLRAVFSSGEQRPPAEALAKVQRSHFYTTRVQPGDVMVLNCAVPHFGVANPDSHDRHVVFLLFSPRRSPAPDTEEQRYPHGVVD